MKKLFLVDAYALIYRSYYAFMSRPMRNSEGLNTSPVFGFVKFLRDIIRRENPHYLGVAFDSKGKTFRHEMYPAYKANREASPEDIHAAVPYIKKVLKAMRIPILEQTGWEADDIIGTVSCRAESQGFEVYMVTPDKDFGQLVREHAFIYKQGKGGDGIQIIGPDNIKENYGIDDARLIIDILALWGDVSDNIPGVPGIGEKSAIKLVCQFGTVENILENIEQLSGKQKENILANREQLLLAKKLATIDIDAPVDFVPEKLIMEDPDSAALRDAFMELGFNMFVKELDNGAFISGVGEVQTAGETKGKVGGVVKADSQANAIQGSLFGDVANDVADTGESEVSGYENTYDTAHTVEHKYHVVKNAGELKELVDFLSTKDEFCFDTETSGFNVYSCFLVGMSFCVEPHEAWYLPLDNNNREECLSLLRPLFENDSIAKIGQNLKFDIMVLANAGIATRGFKYDTMILHYLLDPESRHGMNHLARTYLNYDPIEIEALIGKGARQITMDMVQVDRVAEYAAEDADVTMRLKQELWPRIIAEDLAGLYTTIEEPMIDVLADIEMTGVKIDTDILAQAGNELRGELISLEDKIRRHTGEPNLNINSSRQLGEVLFGKMKIDSKPKLTKTKQYRTDEEYLQSLASANPVIDLILEYRGIKKLLSTYIDALPLLVDPVTGRVHTSYNQAVTATGRLSSSNPNLQNIPIRDAMGREIRKAFVPSDDEHVLLAADYSQVELRLMAHLSEDKNLLDAFEKKEDIHSATASLLFGVPLTEVTSEQRRRAKTANFGIIYGISAFGLSQRLHIPRGEAKEIIDGYFQSYPGVREYMDRVIDEAKEKGYVTTIFGRKRWLNDIKSANSIARGLAERNAINAPIQGSAADIIKLAMIRIHKELMARGLRSKVTMQVHDELVVDMYKPESDEVIRIVTEAMQSAARLKVELIVDAGVGNNWVEAH